MLVTLLLSWLLAAEPACRAACAANAPQATTHRCPSTACDQDATAVRGDESPEILSFEAAWCAPCQEMRSALSRLKQSGVRVRYIDVDREPELARRYRVRNIPAFVSVVNGREVKRTVGACSYRTLLDMVHMTATTSPGASAMAPGATHAEMLVRAKYELCPEKVAAVTQFLEAFAAEDLEVRSGEGTLIVTASPEIQRAVGQMIAAIVKRSSSAEEYPSATIDSAGPKTHRTSCLALRKTSACATEGAPAGCDRGCGESCTNDCGGECTTGCEDGLPSGAAVPGAHGVPLVPPVWMSSAIPSKVMFGRGIDPDSGVCSGVVLDELPVPSLLRLARYRVLEGAGPFYTLVVAGDRWLIDNVRDYVEKKSQDGAAEKESRKRLIFSNGLRTE